MRALLYTTEHLLERHAQLLGQARMTRSELEDRAEAGLLSGEESWLWEEICEVERRLGGCDPGTTRD